MDELEKERFNLNEELRSVQDVSNREMLMNYQLAEERKAGAQRMEAIRERLGLCQKEL